MAKPEDVISRELSSFFKAAASALDEVRDQVVRGGQAGKSVLDAQLLRRQRDKALQKLGEVMLAEDERGAPLPAAGEAIVREIRALDEQLERARAEADKLWRGVTQGTRPPPAHDDDLDDE